MSIVPRPLLVLVVLLIAVGILSCGVAGIKGGPDDDGPDLPFSVDPQPLTATEFASRPCEPSGGRIAISGDCLLTLQGRPFPLRELRVLVESGQAIVRVEQEIRGETRESGQESYEAGERFEVSAAGESDVRVIVVCFPACVLRIVD